MSDFDKYKQHYESIITNWEQSAEILGSQLGKMLESLKLEGLASLAGSAVEVLSMVIPAHLMYNAQDLLGFGYNAATKSKEVAEQQINHLDTLTDFSNKLFYELLSGKIVKPELTEAIINTLHALTNEPKKIPDSEQMLAAILGTMGNSLGEYGDALQDIIKFETIDQNPLSYMKNAALLLEHTKNSRVQSLGKSLNAAVKIVGELQQLNNYYKSIKSPSGFLYYYGDIKNKIEEVLSILKIAKITHIGKHIEAQVPNKANYLEDVQRVMSWELPDATEMYNGVRSILRIASDLIAGTKNLTSDIEHTARQLRNRVMPNINNIKQQFKNFNIEPMKKYASQFVQEVEHIAENLNADRFASLIKEGDVKEIFNITELTSTFEGYMCKQIADLKQNMEGINEQVRSAIDQLYTEFLAEHNVKVISGAQYSDIAGKLQQEIEEVRRYIAEMEKLWQQVNQSTSG